MVNSRGNTITPRSNFTGVTMCISLLLQKYSLIPVNILKCQCTTKKIIYCAMEEQGYTLRSRQNSLWFQNFPCDFSASKYNIYSTITADVDRYILLPIHILNHNLKCSEACYKNLIPLFGCSPNQSSLQIQILCPATILVHP